MVGTFKGLMECTNCASPALSITGTTDEVE